MKSKIIKNSQSSIILNWFKAHPHISVDATYFMNGKGPFVGYSTSARLSEMKSLGLLKKVGVIKNSDSKRADRDLYAITELGINYEIGTRIPTILDMSDEILRRSQLTDEECINEILSIKPKKTWKNLFGLLILIGK